MKFHWMFNNTEMSLLNLKEHSDELDSYGYESMLLVYDPKLPDYWVRAANIIDPKQKIKYMFALRTYAVTPEFTAMMCESFNEISKDRIVLNICAGDKAQMENELEIDGFIDPDGLKYDSFKRVVYTRLWIEKFLNLKTIQNFPKLVFSGSSDYTIETTNAYGDSTLCMYNLFKDSPKRFTSGKATMVALAILLDDNKDSAVKKLKESGVPNAENWTICGSEDDIINQINEIKSMGATDILIVNPFEHLDSSKIHRLVKSMNLRENKV